MTRLCTGVPALFALLLLVTAQPVFATEATNPAKELVGLWAARRDFTPDVHGLLTIYTIDGQMHAELAGFTLPVSNNHGELRFDLPGERGYFRGGFSQDKQAIKGHFVQAWTYRGIARFASPVNLTALPSGGWQGELTPLTDELHFYLVIEEQADGRVSMFMRNPEANIGRFYRIEKVVKNGPKVAFVDGDGSTRLEGSYNADSGQLSVYFYFNGGTYDFVRVNDDPGSRFFPRPENDRKYSYTPPPSGEGWLAGSLADVGMATEPIEDLMQMIIDTPMDALDAPYLHAFLIARHGKLVVEEYFHGYSRHMPHASRSAAKTLTTTLAGMAVQQGFATLETPVYETMNGAENPADLDPRAQRMNLLHLITMTPGFACDDRDGSSPGGEDRMQEQKEQPDWHRYSLDLPMLHDAGEHAAYCSGSSNLAGGVVAKTSGDWLPEFYRKYFAEPLETGLYHMNLTPVGEGYGGGGLYIKPRDFLKLGQLHLDDGKWDGRQLLPPGWSAAALTAHNMIGKEGYGYGWWIFSYPYKGHELKAIYAGGNGGQYVIVIPEMDLNIVIFGGNYNQQVMHKPKYQYVRDYVLPAVLYGETRKAK